MLTKLGLSQNTGYHVLALQGHGLAHPTRDEKARQARVDGDAGCRKARLAWAVLSVLEQEKQCGLRVALFVFAP